jgi:DNA-binding MarR family transcriptional regulator
VVSRIEAALEEGGLVPLVWYDVLVAIAKAPRGRLRLKEVGSNLMLTRSGATRLVDRLEGAGLVRRERLKGDRRGTAAALTPAGRQALRAAWPVYAKGINKLFLGRLSEEELAALGPVLARIADSVSEP